MMPGALIKILGLTVLGTMLSATAGADVLLDETDMVGLPNVAPPAEFSFTAATAQALTVTLTDFQLPTAFGSLQIAVTLGDGVVGTPVSVDPTTHTATVILPPAAGDYVLHVIGTPDASQGVGGFGVCVAPSATVTDCIDSYSFSGLIQTPAAISTSGTSTLNTNFNSTKTAGSYIVTLTDDGFPVALQSLSAGIFAGSTPVMVNIPAGTPTQVTLAAGTNYQLLVAAQADSTVLAGLYGIKITDPSGATVFERTLPVGTMPGSTTINATAAQSLNLILTDFAYPAPLSQVGVAVTEKSASLAQLTAPGTVSNFMAAAGTLEVWQFATAAAQPGVYSVSLASSAASLLSNTQVVNPGPATAQQSFAFVVNLSSAGSYNLAVSDFQFPSSLQGLTATVAQNGVPLAQDSSGNFTAAAGNAIVVVDATPPQNGNGIFAVTVATSGASPQVVYEQTQGVGGVFQTRTINLGTSGNFDVTLADLGFPALFDNLAVVASNGSKVLGKIYGGGTFTIPATPGQYMLTFIATPNSTGDASTQNYGLYSIRMASSAPTITLTAGASTITAGKPVQLTWSSTDATACTAGGDSAWTGSKATSGTAAVVLSATATLTLTCTGSGGSASQSVTVTVTAAPPASGGGGGGAIDTLTLAALCTWLLIRGVNPRARQRSGARRRTH
jgi:hypothetical protein